MLYVKHFKIMNRLFRVRVDKVEGQFALLPGIGIVWVNPEWAGVSLVWGAWGIAFQARRKKVQTNERTE